MIELTKNRILIFLDFDRIESISKAALGDDSAVLVMSSGVEVKIVAGFNDLFAKIKRHTINTNIV